MTSRPSVYDKGPFLRVPEPFNMAAHTLAAAARSADKVALEVLESPGRVAEAWRFGDLDTAVRGTLTGFRRAGIMPGDRVFLCLGSSVAFPLAFFALAGMGALPVPISPQWTAGELERAARDLHPVAAVGRPVPGARHIPKPALAEWRDLPPGDFAVTRPDDPAYIVFTSGTGGHARAVVHAHRAAWARRMMWRDWMDLRNGDRVLHTGALNWTYTLGTGLTDPWAAGATALIHAGPLAPADWAPLIAAHRPTLFASVPGIYRQILQTAPRADAFTSLRHGLSAGEALHPRIAADWRALTGVPVLEALGMSEVSTYASARPGRPVPVPQRGRRVAVLGTDGAPVASGRIGDLAVSARDPGLMLGYWAAQGPDLPLDLPLTGEWFVTGDRAEMAEDGALRHRGRRDDILNAQGYRVSATEVETVLMEHPDIAEAAVIAAPVRASVDVLTAVVVAAPGMKVGADGLAAHCAERLARYKIPRRYVMLAALPRTATGKLKRRDLGRMLEHMASAGP